MQTHCAADYAAPTISWLLSIMGHGMLCQGDISEATQLVDHRTLCERCYLEGDVAPQAGNPGFPSTASGGGKQVFTDAHTGGVSRVKSAQSVDEASKAASGADGVSGGIKVLVLPRQHLLDSATDPKLKSRIDKLYRPNAVVGNGSTADVIRHELSTGELLSPKGHFQKGIEMRDGLLKDIKSGRLNEADTAITRLLLKDLQNALSGQ